MRNLLNETKALVDAATPDGFVPSEELKRGEVLIGLVPDDLKPLGVVAFRAEAVLDAKIAEANKMIEDKTQISEEDYRRICAEIQMLNLVWDAARTPFINSVRLEFPDYLHLRQAISVRKDWQVVLVPERRAVLDIPMPGFLASALKGALAGGCDDPNCPMCGPGRRGGRKPAEA